MSNFRNFAFSKKKMENETSPQLRPFLLGRPRDEALAIIKASRPNKRISRQSFIQMDVLANGRPNGLRGASGQTSNQPKIYVPFAPQPSDLESLMAPKMPGARCPKCNSNIVLSNIFKSNGQVNIAEAHLGEVFTFSLGVDENGTTITAQMVWACRINRHIFPASGSQGMAPVIEPIDQASQTAARRLTFSGAQRWVNEMQELLRIGDAIRARECMTQIVLMNEGMKAESFSWLEKEKASRLAAALNLPKEISTLQEEEKTEEPSDSEKLLKAFFDEEGDTIYRMITSNEGNFEYSGIAIDSSSQSSVSNAVNDLDDKNDISPPVIQNTKDVTTAATYEEDANEGLSISENWAESHVFGPKPSRASLHKLPQDHHASSTTTSKGDSFTPRPSSKRFSLTNLFSNLKKGSPSIKRIEGKRDLGKYVEEQAVTAAVSSTMLPVPGQSVSLQEMLQEPFNRIAEGSLRNLSGGQRASYCSTTTSASAYYDIPEYSITDISDKSVSNTKSGTPSFNTDRSHGDDSVHEVEHGLTVVTISSAPSGKRSVSGNSIGLRGTNQGGDVYTTDDGDTMYSDSSSSKY